MKTDVHFWSYLAQFFLELETFQINILEKITTHFVISIFFENRVVYEIMWKNIIDRGRPQMTIWRMRIACWITKVTNTLSCCVILTAFHCNNGYTNAPPCYVIRHLFYVIIVGVEGYRRVRSHPVTHTHTHTHTHTLGRTLLEEIGPSQRPLPDNTQHSQQRDIHAPQRDSNPRSLKAAADRSLKPWSHRGQLLKYLTFKVRWLLYTPPGLTFKKKFYVLPTQCIYVFCMDLITNSDYFSTQH